MNKSSTSIDKASGLMNQVIIYSKGWYKHSANSINDIRKIIAKVTACHPSYISENCAKEVIIRAFETYVSTYDRIEAVMKSLGVKKLFPNQEPDPYDFMLGSLSIIKGEYVDMDEKIDISFDKQFVIYSKSEDGYWSNEQGWVDEVDSEDDKMVFSDKDRDHSYLPDGGEWKEYTPAIN